jgi:hypothetical protein
MLMVNGTPLQARAAMVDQRRLAARVMRLPPHCATIIPANLDGALLEAMEAQPRRLCEALVHRRDSQLLRIPEPRAQASPRIGPEPRPLLDRMPLASAIQL